LRFRLELIALALALGLCACGTTGNEPPVKTVTVNVPVVTKCSPKIDPEPVYPDTDAALANAPDVFSGVKLLMAGRGLRAAYVGELQGALKACTG
jgi:hypothetical protein